MPALLEMLVDVGSVRFGDFTLSSGKRSSYYVDIKRAITEPVILSAIARRMGRRWTGEDLIGGTELGAVPIAAAVSMDIDVPYVIVRKGGREHGTGKRIEGADVSGMKVLLVEDVITTAGSVARAVEALRKAGATVHRVIAVVDRQEGGREVLSELNVTLEALLTADEILEVRS